MMTRMSCHGWWSMPDVSVVLMKKSMFGTRDAASNWERDWEEHVKKWRFQMGLSSKNLFHHTENRVSVLTHGDDFVLTGPTKKLMEFERKMTGHFGSSHFRLELPIVICSQWVRFCFGPCVSRSRRLSLVFWLVIGSGGFQTQKKSWVSGQVRAERILAEATTIDGRKEWTYMFCSETHVWPRWRCRRCCNNIQAGLHGKYRQAIAAEWSAGSSASSGEEKRKARSLEAENEGLRARIDAMEKKGGVQGDPSIPSREGGDSEEVWRDGMEVEDEAECRRKMDE